VEKFLAETANGCLWGLYTNGTSPGFKANYLAIETGSGRQFDIVKRYYEMNLAGPDQEHMDLVNQGRIPHLAWALRYTSSTWFNLMPTPLDQVNKVWKYTQITDGSCDAYIDALGDRLLQLLPPAQVPYYFWGLNHEPENISTTYRKECFSDPGWYDSSGTTSVQRQTETAHKDAVIAEFPAAAAYMAARLRARGCTNLIFVCTFASGSRTDWEYRGMYIPECDVIAYDPYDGSSPASRWPQWFNRVDAGMLDAKDPNAKNKPRMLSEWGFLNSTINGTYILGAPDGARATSNLRAVQFYSSASSNIVGNQSAIDAFRTASQDPIFNPRG
jgi:hypothetical protein